MHANSHNFEQNAQQKFLFGMVATENLLLIGCSSFYIVYENLVIPSYHFFVSAVEEQVDFAVGGMHTNSHIFEQNAPQHFLFEMVTTENSLLVGCSSFYIVYENLFLSSYHFFVTAVEEKS
jgi:hypothetical protein